MRVSYHPAVKQDVSAILKHYDAISKPVLDCAGKAQRRRRFCFPRSGMTCLARNRFAGGKSDVALRLPPQSMTRCPADVPLRPRHLISQKLW